VTEKLKDYEGGCTCGDIRYKVATKPLIVHCCHCRWCQRQTGASFALNALIERERVEVLQGNIDEIMVPSPGGNGQIIVRCPNCRVAVWSHYLSMGQEVRFIRVGSLDSPDLLPPDVHIYTTTKQPWVILPPDDYAVDEFYVVDETWSPDSLKRREAMFSDRKLKNTADSRKHRKFFAKQHKTSNE
jgi:hypothetical protein